MPIYDYICSQCKATKEVLVPSFNSEVLCDECNAVMDRQLSTPNVIYRGDGFYTTEQRKSAIRNNTEATDREE